jgi:hypothetical protein
VFVNLTRAQTGDEPIENAAMVAEEITRWLRDVAGFKGFLMLSREGASVGLSFWESREAAEQHRLMRAQFRERMLTIAGVEFEETESFEVTFAELPPF